MGGKVFPQKLLAEVYQIFMHFLAGMSRTRQIVWYPEYKQLFNNVCEAQLMRILKNDNYLHNSIESRNTNDEESLKIARVNYLIACYDNSVSPPLASFNLDFITFYAKFILPNFKAIHMYLRLHSNNIDQICSFLDDLSFGMESQYIEVATHNFIATVYRASEELRMTVRTMICSFLFQYLPQISKGQIKGDKIAFFNSGGLPLW